MSFTLEGIDSSKVPGLEANIMARTGKTSQQATADP